MNPPSFRVEGWLVEPARKTRAFHLSSFDAVDRGSRIRHNLASIR